MMQSRVEVQARARALGDGLLAEIAGAVRGLSPGGLIELTGASSAIAADLERWTRLTGHALVGQSADGASTFRFLIRKAGGVQLAGAPPVERERRLWLYVNFDCNLACDYCCVRSSPRATRRDLGLETVGRVAEEAAELGFERLLITGGEPFLLADIGEQVGVCAARLPTTVLTNAMLFTGPRRTSLESLPRDRVTLQVSLDSASPELHDLHRGKGSWQRARDGIAIARGLGFRVRVAATVSSEEEGQEMDRFLVSEGVPPVDRVIRPVALRGVASEGMPLSRAEIEPEPTVTSQGLYWHPVGADDADFLVHPEPLPLSRGLEALERKQREDREFGSEVARVFQCA